MAEKVANAAPKLETVDVVVMIDGLTLNGEPNGIGDIVEITVEDFDAIIDLGGPERIKEAVRKPLKA